MQTALQYFIKHHDRRKLLFGSGLADSAIQRGDSRQNPLRPWNQMDRKSESSFGQAAWVWLGEKGGYKSLKAAAAESYFPALSYKERFVRTGEGSLDQGLLSKIRKFHISF